MARTWSRLGIAGQFYLLGAIVFLPFVLIIALKIQADFQQRITDDSTTAFRHARNVAEQAARFNRQSFEILRGLALRPAIRAMSSSPCDPVFEHFLSANKSYANLLLDNAAGDVICNAAKGPNLKGLVTHRPWFRNLMATAARQTGDPTVGQVVGRWIVALAEPVVDAAGRARGALVLTVDLWNYQFHLDRDFAESYFLVTILDSQGAVVARSRDSSRWVGKKIRLPLETIRSIRAGDGKFVGDADGVEHLYGHAAVPGTDWVVLVSSPKSIVDSVVSERIWFELPFAGLLFFLLFSAAYLVAKRIRQPVEAAARAAEAVGDGRFDVRLPESGGNRELGILAQKFNRMAERLRVAETRQAQAIADLAGSEAQMRLIADNVPIAISYLDAGLRYRFVNRSFSEIFGSGPQDALGKHLREIAGDAAYAAVESRYAQALAGREVAYEWTLTRPGADARDIETRLIPHFPDANRVDGCYALTLDVTERKLAEAARGWLAAIVENSNDAIIGRSLDGRILSWNAAAERLFGYRANEAIGRPITVIMPPGEHAQAQDNSAVLQEGGDVPRAEAVRQTKDGQLITVLRSVSPIRNAAGEVIGAAITARDITERKRAEEARAWLAAIVEHSNDAIIGRSLDGRILSWNAAAERLFGYSADEMIGGPITRILPPGLHASVERHTVVLQGGADIPPEEAEWQTKERGRISVMRGLSPIKNARGEVMGAAITARDISESKRAEEALRRFRVALDNTADMILLIDRATMRYVDVNETACRMLGYTREELTSIGPQDVLSRSREELERTYDALIANPSVMESTQEYDFRRKDGSTFPIEAKRHVLRSGDGYLIAAIARDVRTRRRDEAQQRLAASVFDNALDGIMITDAAFRIVAVNRAFTAITGYSAPEAIGSTPRLLRSYRHDEAFYRAMQETIKGTGNWQGEVWDKRRNGELYCELLSISPVRNERCEVTNYCAIFADITRLKATESELMTLNAQLEERVAQRTAALDEANRELETFSYSVSHDLRAPLRHISGFSAIVLERNEGRLDRTSVEYLERINAASERMGQIISDLLALARISRQELNRRDFDLSGLAGEVAGSLLETHPGRDVQVTLAPGMKANGDPGLVRIVLENLLGNAWKFTARAGEPSIEVGLDESGGEPAYYIRDNGAGFDMEYAHRLFAPFERLHTDAEFEGTGIGLSIVQRIVSRHGGRVWAQAETGKGATFYFTLGESGKPAGT